LISLVTPHCSNAFFFNSLFNVKERAGEEHQQGRGDATKMEPRVDKNKVKPVDTCKSNPFCV